MAPCLSASAKADNSLETTPLMLESGDSAADKAAGPLSQPSVSASASKSCSGDSAETGRGKASMIAVGLAAASVYIGLSSSMIMFNKFLMREYVFPFPVALTTMHMVCALCLGMCLQRLCPALYPAFPNVFGQRSCGTQESDGPLKEINSIMHSLLPFAPIAVCGALSLVMGNAAYQYASVSFLQMVKESHVMFVYVLMLMVGLEPLKFHMAFVIMFITVSSMIAVYGEVYFSWQGLALQLFSGGAASSQIVLNSLLMTKSSVGKIDPLTLVLCTAPVMLVALLPANIVFWDAKILGRIQLWLPYLAANALLAFALQISAATLIWVCSGTGYALASVAKDLAIVAAAQVILHESFTTVQVLGFAGSITGMVVYSLLKVGVL